MEYLISGIVVGVVCAGTGLFFFVRIVGLVVGATLDDGRGGDDS